MMYLKPSNIFYSQHQISATFGKWNRHRNTTIGETLDDLCNGRCKISDIETIKVVKKDGKWCTIDNRRLWVFHHLEAAGKCTEIPVEEVQYCPLTHGRKFSSTDGGKSVTIIKGKRPGGIWHTRVKPVTPTEENKNKSTESESKSNTNDQSSLEKDNPPSTGSANGALHAIDIMHTKGTVNQNPKSLLSEHCQVNGAAVVGKQIELSAPTDKTAVISDVTSVFNDTVDVNSDDFTERMRHIWSGKPLRLLNGVGLSIRSFGKSVTNKKGKSQGGTWHTRVKPVTPTEENKNKSTGSESTSITNDQSSLERDNPPSTGSANGALHAIDTIHKKRTVNQNPKSVLSEQCKVNGAAVTGKQTELSAPTDKTAVISDVLSDIVDVNSDEFTERMRHIWSGKPLRLLSGVGQSIRLLESLKIKLMKIECGSQNRYKPYDYNLTNRYATRHLRFTQLFGKFHEANYSELRTCNSLIEEEPENIGTVFSENVLCDYMSSSADEFEISDDLENEIIDTDENNESKEIDYDDDPWSDDDTYKNDWSDDDFAMLTDDRRNTDDDEDQNSDSDDNNESKESDNDYLGIDAGETSDNFCYELEYDELDVWENESDKNANYYQYPDSNSSDFEDDFLIAKEVEKREKRERFLNDILSNYTLNVKHPTTSVDNRLSVALSVTTEPVVPVALKVVFSASQVCNEPEKCKQNSITYSVSSSHFLDMSTTSSNENTNTISQAMHTNIYTPQCIRPVNLTSSCEAIESPVTVGCALEVKSFSVNCTTSLIDSIGSINSVCPSSFCGVSQSDVSYETCSSTTVTLPIISANCTDSMTTSFTTSLIAPVTTARITNSSYENGDWRERDIDDDEDYEDDDDEDTDDDEDYVGDNEEDTDDDDDEDYVTDDTEDSEDYNLTNFADRSHKKRHTREIAKKKYGYDLVSSDSD